MVKRYSNALKRYVEVKFKGGPIFQNSGGQGPDDYLIKPIEGGRWTRVIFRFGRNSKVRVVGGVVVKDRDMPLVAMRSAALADKAMQSAIFPLQQECVSDCARRWQRMKERGSAPTMSATDFVVKYGRIE